MLIKSSSPSIFSSFLAKKTFESAKINHDVSHVSRLLILDIANFSTDGLEELAWSLKSTSSTESFELESLCCEFVIRLSWTEAKRCPRGERWHRRGVKANDHIYQHLISKTGPSNTKTFWWNLHLFISVVPKKSYEDVWKSWRSATPMKKLTMIRHVVVMSKIKEMHQYGYKRSRQSRVWFILIANRSRWRILSGGHHIRKLLFFKNQRSSCKILQ